MLGKSNPFVEEPVMQTDEWRDFAEVVVRALKMIIAYLERRYNLKPSDK